MVFYGGRGTRPYTSRDGVTFYWEGHVNTRLEMEWLFVREGTSTLVSRLGGLLWGGHVHTRQDVQHAQNLKTAITPHGKRVRRSYGYQGSLHNETHLFRPSSRNAKRKAAITRHGRQVGKSLAHDSNGLVGFGLLSLARPTCHRAACFCRILPSLIGVSQSSERKPNKVFQDTSVVCKFILQVLSLQMLFCKCCVCNLGVAGVSFAFVLQILFS